MLPVSEPLAQCTDSRAATTALSHAAYWVERQVHVQLNRLAGKNNLHAHEHSKDLTMTFHLVQPPFLSASLSPTHSSPH